MYKAEGPALQPGMSFYLGPDGVFVSETCPVGFREFRQYDTITDEQYANALPETKRLIDDLVIRQVLRRESNWFFARRFELLFLYFFHVSFPPGLN